MHTTRRHVAVTLVATAAAAATLATAGPIAQAAAPAPVTASSSPRPVRTSDRITYAGLGTLRIGATTDAQLRSARMVVPGQCVRGWDSGTALRRAGVWVSLPQGSRLADIDVTSPRIRTWSGAHVGMTIAEARRIYGQRFHVKTLTTDGLGSFAAGQVTNGRREILFMTRDGKVTPSSRISVIHVRDVASYLPGWDAC